ncbi:uncharacterized protein LOC118204024, partial [Stegodyphus dumicola]|uniref:uncharacterized protein LOC118204024 n=1 Tax=Stegodyphus dumicola TaxID=202533 RepID=UPI0015AABF70
MAQYEFARLLDNQQNGIDNENLQQYVEIGTNTYIGTKDGMKYTLVQTPDNKLRLCEVPNDCELNEIISKESCLTPDERRHEDDSTMTFTGKAIKIVPLKVEPSPCKGQGDESGNSIIVTPDPAPPFKSEDNSIPEKGPEAMEESQMPESPHLTYTTLVTKHERADTPIPINHAVNGNSFLHHMTPVHPPLTIRPARYVRARSRMHSITSAPTYPASPIPYVPVPRQRRPKHTWSPYS